MTHTVLATITTDNVKKLLMDFLLPSNHYHKNKNNNTGILSWVQQILKLVLEVDQPLLQAQHQDSSPQEGLFSNSLTQELTEI